MLKTGLNYFRFKSTEYLQKVEAKAQENAELEKSLATETPMETSEVDSKVTGDDRDVDEANPPKRQRLSKKEKRKGQNKTRPAPYKETRAEKLCKSVVNGDPDGPKCTYPNCAFIHDIEKYMCTKSKDIADSCYIYSTKGYCNYGVACRFAKSHLDDNFKNIKKDGYKEESVINSTFNQISFELQSILRKKKYNFDPSQKVVDDIEKQRNLNKAENKSEEKMHGFCPDTDLIKERPSEIKKIDFKNKLFLSPLTTVGNLPFRRICKEYGADVTCGEMACSIPLINGAAQEWALTKRHESEDIFGVQLCGHKANLVAYAAQVLNENCNIDFFDLNLGCPIDLIYQQGGGSALIRRQPVLETMIRSCSQILNGKPFTVKTRTGVYANKNVAHELLPKFEEWGASMVTVHGRSREQRYTKKADWEYIQKCALQVKNIPVVLNGDILSFEDYNEAKVKL